MTLLQSFFRPASATNASAGLPFLAPIGLVAAAVVVIVLLRALLSPLRHIPGTFWSRFTSAALRWHELHGHRTRYVHALHRRYGPVVRLAPGEVSFSSAAAVKEIYNTAGSGFDKTEFYDSFKIYGRRTMFTTLTKGDHARRRRILADRYANSNIMKPASLNGIEDRSRVFAQCCQEAPKGTLDIYVTAKTNECWSALHAYAFDCITHHLFHPYGTDSLRKDSDAEIMREVTFDDSLQNRLIKFYNPTLHAVIGRVLSLFYKPRETPLADNFVLETSARDDTSPFTLVSRMHEKLQPAAADDSEKQAAASTAFDFMDAAAESLDHMAAGIDTTGDALCFLMWELSQPRSQSFQERLRQELLEHQKTQQQGGDQGAEGRTLFDSLPFLEAVVMEGLRCYPAIPMSLPRLVPGPDWEAKRSSNSRENGRLIDGVFVPTGTVVSCQAYSVHRMDSSVFPDPDTFNPDRWLQDDGNDAERKRFFFAFASGGRGCIGKHLARVEMKILLRDIYSRFATAPDPCMTRESMEMTDQMISSRPLGQRCLLQFTPLDESL